MLNCVFYTGKIYIISVKVWYQEVKIDFARNKYFC
ncbi:hypothetical protein IMSAGC020_02173 [Lachnospiraceae bacterium]|nr:hypothetical protein IMSAGC020_02173 [Lachnospiraceae bacterium]